MVKIGKIRIKMDNLLVNTNVSTCSDCSMPNFTVNDIHVYQINCN